MADLKKIKSAAVRIDDTFKCMMHQTSDSAEYNVTSCCGNLICTECFKSLIKDQAEKEKKKEEERARTWYQKYTDTVSEDTSLCPSCRKPGWKLIRKLPWVNEVQKESSKLVESIQAAISISGRPPCREGSAQTDLVTVCAQPGLRTCFKLCQLLSWTVFPELHRLAIQGGRIFLTGKELRMLQTLNAVAVKFSAYPTEQQFLNALGVQYYRLLYAMEATVFDYGDIAALLEKMSAPAKFIADVALPEEHFRPKVLRKLQDSTEYVMQWVRPFAAGGKFDVVQAILERFGLSCIRKPLDFEAPHAVHGPCTHRCAKCRVYSAVRNEDFHQYKMESKKEYYVLCALCGLKVDWNKMEQHVRTRHNKARWEVCRRCWAPTDGPHAQDIPHCVVCPLRQFPLSPGLRGERYRHPPLPLTVEEPSQPLTYPRKMHSVWVTLEAERSRGRDYWKLSWDV